MRDFHGPRLELLAAAGPDLLAVETIPDADEAEVLVPLLDELGLPAWFSYSVRGPSTNAGQPLPEAYDVVAGSTSVVAAGVNCSEQTDVLGAVAAAVAATGLPAVAYPNRGGSWNAATKTWEYAGPLDLGLVDDWVAAGARFIGGCCGTGPATSRSWPTGSGRSSRRADAPHTSTVSRTSTTSPSSSPSGLRTASLTGTTYPPSRGHSEVVNSVSPIRPRTGIIPQP